MPTTRAARRSAAERQLLELPADVLGLVLYQLTLAHDIAAVAPTCHALCDAAKLTRKLRPFSGEVVTIAGHTDLVCCATAARGGLVITGGYDDNLKFWRDGACVRTIHGGEDCVNSLAMLPGGERFLSCSFDRIATLYKLDGTVERTFEVAEVGEKAFAIAALPDGVHFLVSFDKPYVVRLYHVDGTLVHTFEGHTAHVYALAVTPDGQHIISGSDDHLVKVWSVANKSLVSTCESGGRVLALAAIPDGKRILSGSTDDTVRVWHLDGTLKNTFSELHDGPVQALVALPDKQHALSGAFDASSVKLFNVNDGAVLRNFFQGQVMCLALLPDGLRFVSGLHENTAHIVYHGLAPCV